MADKAKMKQLYWDIETAQNLVAVFGLAHNDWIDPSSIVRERFMICASWQVEGESKVHSVSVLDDPARFKKDPYDDYHVVKTLHKVMQDVDCLVHHNGDSYDKKWLDTRILFHGLPALPPVSSIDTYKVAKSKLYLNSNKLAYLGGLLKVGGKKATTPGLWMRVLRGDKKAIKDMESYNRQDVVLLRNVFKKLQPYISNHLNRELYGGTGCPRCGSKKIQSRGFHRAISRTYRRFQCQACAGWFRAVMNEKEVKPKTRVL